MEILFVDLLKDFGPVVAAIAFFVWRDWKREQSMTRQIETTDQWIRNVLLKALDSNTKAMTELTDSMTGCQCFANQGARNGR